MRLRNVFLCSVAVLAAIVVLVVPVGADLTAAAFVLQDETPETNQIFGSGVAIGDINADGIEDVVVGACCDLGGEGEVFVYLGDNPFPSCSKIRPNE